MAVPPLIPRSVLFGDPPHLYPELSPSGGHIAFLGPSGGALNICVEPTAGRADAGRRVLTDFQQDVRFFTWAPDGRHILYLTDTSGDERHHVHVADVVTGVSRDLTPYRGVQAGIVAVAPSVPGRALITMNRRDPRVFDAYRVDLATGEAVLAAENPGQVTRWLADAELRCVGAVRQNPSGGTSILVRAGEADEWRPCYTVTTQDAQALDPLAFTADGTGLIMLSSQDARASRLIKLDVTDGSTQVFYEDPDGYDVVDVHLDPRSRRPGLVGIQRERNDVELLDAALGDDLTALRKLCRGDVGLLGGDLMDERWLVVDGLDVEPGAYYLYDRRTGNSAFLYDHLPELRGYELAEMEPFSFTARDGLAIHGYLSYPPGAGRRGLPVVLDVHGGPWTRDRWGFRAETQWLANRGYLCVNVNYRGSTGYGKEFVNAGDREWGGRMQDDLIDAVRYLVRIGAADPGRIAIYGASYGGYAALVGATFTPEVFCCAIAVAAPSDLRTFFASTPDSWSPALAELHRRIGDPATEADFLWSRSPLSRVDAIQIPVLIVQGANDPRVRQRESDQIVAAMRQKGIAHEYLIFPDEGHGIVQEANRQHFYATAERFLAEHLGGRRE